jgi:hypothetical protein
MPRDSPCTHQISAHHELSDDGEQSEQMIFPTTRAATRAMQKQVLADLRGDVLQLQLRKLVSNGKHLLALVHLGISQFTTHTESHGS